MGCALGCSPIAKLLPLKIKVFNSTSFNFFKTWHKLCSGLVGIRHWSWLKGSTVLGEILLHSLTILLQFYETDMENNSIFHLLLMINPCHGRQSEWRKEAKIWLRTPAREAQAIRAIRPGKEVDKGSEVEEAELWEEEPPLKLSGINSSHPLRFTAEF